jgi:hypothetical protein
MANADEPTCPVSLIVARMRDTTIPGYVCPDTLTFCPGGTAVVRLRDISLLSGSEVPDGLTAVFRREDGYSWRGNGVLVVWRDREFDRWRARVLTSVKPGGVACVNRSDLETLKIGSPPGSWRKKDALCFRP